MADDEGVTVTVVSDDVFGGTGGSILEGGDGYYTDVTNMVDTVSLARKEHCVKRLIIVAHGVKGPKGCTIFDVSGQGAQMVWGGHKEDPLQPTGQTDAVKRQLERLKSMLCPGAIIEFRCCEFGTGDDGTRVMQAIADATGAAVIAPMDEIKPIAGIGGLSVQWKCVYAYAPVVETGFFRDPLLDPADWPKKPVSPVLPVKGYPPPKTFDPQPIPPKPWTAQLTPPVIAAGAVIALVAAGSVVVAKVATSPSTAHSDLKPPVSQPVKPVVPGASIEIPGPAPGSPEFRAFTNSFNPAIYTTEFAIDVQASGSSPLVYVWSLPVLPCGKLFGPEIGGKTNGYYHGPFENNPEGCPPPPGIEIDTIVEVLVARASDIDAKGNPRPGTAYLIYRQVARAGDAENTKNYDKHPEIKYYGPPGYTPG